MNTGTLGHQDLNRLIEAGQLSASALLADSQIQPASVDLRAQAKPIAFLAACCHAW